MQDTSNIGKADNESKDADMKSSSMYLLSVEGVFHCVQQRVIFCVDNSVARVAFMQVLVSHEETTTWIAR
jgi:hypothetical protein